MQIAGCALPQSAAAPAQHGASAAALLAAVSLLLSCPEAHAYNVRLQDVESPQIRAGVEAATSGDLLGAERVGGAVPAAQAPRLPQQL